LKIILSIENGKEPKFITRPHKKFTWVKNMSETNKKIVPEAAGKTNAAIKNEKVSNPDVKIKTPK
jgi:hypothetical protein